MCALPRKALFTCRLLFTKNLRISLPAAGCWGRGEVTAHSLVCWQCRYSAVTISVIRGGKERKKVFYERMLYNIVYSILRTQSYLKHCTVHTTVPTLQILKILSADFISAELQLFCLCTNLSFNQKT